tara:strand:- start:277 stop:570 length:294 start_codon:yes stop_codon:yes gene_type:complete
LLGPALSRCRKPASRICACVLTLPWASLRGARIAQRCASGVWCCPPTRRPTEVDLLIGDPAKAAAELGWTASTTLDQLCEEMVKSDLDLLEKGDFTS